MLLRRRMSRLTRTTEKLVGWVADTVVVARLDVHDSPMLYAPDLAGQPAAAVDRNRRGCRFRPMRRL